jgi:hypothetical protein
LTGDLFYKTSPVQLGFSFCDFDHAFSCQWLTGKVVNIKGHSYRLKEHAFNQKGLQPQGGEIVNTLPT